MSIGREKIPNSGAENKITPEAGKRPMASAALDAMSFILFQNAGTGIAAVSFDANGEPFRGDDGRPLASGGVLLANERSTIAVALAPLTGRTTIGAVTGKPADPANAFAAPVQP